MAKSLNTLAVGGEDWPEFAEWLALELAQDASLRLQWENDNATPAQHSKWHEEDQRRATRQLAIMETMFAREVTTWRHLAMLVAVAVAREAKNSSPRNAFAVGCFANDDGLWEVPRLRILTLLGQHILTNNILPEVPFEDRAGSEV